MVKVKSIRIPKKSKLDRILSLLQKRAEIIGIILMILGVCFLINSLFFEVMNIGFIINSILINIKFGVTLILIAIYVIYICPTRKKAKDSRIGGGGITLFVTAWILIIFSITIYLELDTYLILVILGLLTFKELTDEFVDHHLKKRMKFLSYIFLIIFIVVLGQRIISILNI